MFGPISGAHLNPAVTTAFVLRKETGMGDAGLYIVAQVVGAILGVWTAHAMFEISVLQTSGIGRTGAAQWFAEWVATFGAY